MYVLDELGHGAYGDLDWDAFVGSSSAYNVVRCVGAGEKRVLPVQIVQIHVVHAQSLERRVNLLASVIRVSVRGRKRPSRLKIESKLGREEYLVAFPRLLEPGERTQPCS